MSLYRDHIFPRLMDWVLRGERIRQERHRLLADIHGEALEIGFGTGLNLPYYPRTITRLHATDPATFLPNRVAARIAEVAFPVHVQQTGAETLPYEDNRFDYVISTFTLCTVSDPIASLRECRRVLKTVGSLVFLEHGRSEDSRIAKWQDRLNPIQNALGCGCNLNRPIAAIIQQAGFRCRVLEKFVLPEVPRIGGDMYRGIAIPSRSKAGR